MKPPKFNYLRPKTLNEALSFLEEHGDDSKIISGGQSLIPLLSMRLSTPDYLIDLGKLEELSYIQKENNHIKIGAMTRQSEIENSDMVSKHCPILQEAIQHVGYPQIRNQGTIGGSIAHADPSAELPCVISALRGQIVIAGSDGDRIVSPEEFFLTYLLTTLDETELIKEVRFPILSERSGSAYVEVSRRAGDFALVGVAATLELDEAGSISLVQLAVSGANPTPCVLDNVESYLLGKKPSESLFAEASDLVEDLIDPDGDLHGSADYRRQLSKVLTKSTLEKAFNRTKGDNQYE